MADGAKLGQPECTEHRGRHAVGCFQIDAVHDALPARVVSGLGLGRLYVSRRRVHAATPIQFLHSDTASMALVPKASAPVKLHTASSTWPPPIMILSLSRRQAS